MTWRKIESNLTKVDVQEEFQRFFWSLGAPKGMALFDSKDTIKNHTFYFSPRCEAIIKPFLDNLGCIPCDKPDKDYVGFVAGHNSDIEDLL